MISYCGMKRGSFACLGNYDSVAARILKREMQLRTALNTSTDRHWSRIAGKFFWNTMKEKKNGIGAAITGDILRSVHHRTRWKQFWELFCNNHVGQTKSQHQDWIVTEKKDSLDGTNVVFEHILSRTTVLVVLTSPSVCHTPEIKQIQK